MRLASRRPVLIGFFRLFALQYSFSILTKRKTNNNNITHLYFSYRANGLNHIATVDKVAIVRCVSFVVFDQRPFKCV